MSDSAPVQNNFSSDAVQYAKKSSYYAPSTGGGSGSSGVTQIVVDAVDVTGSITLEGINGVTVSQNGSNTITIDGTLGGVTSIVAGTGITITPTTGLGAVTVNADVAVPPGYSAGYMANDIEGSSMAWTWLSNNPTGTASNPNLLTQLEIGKSYTGVFCVHIGGFPYAGTGSLPAGQQPNVWILTFGAGVSGGQRTLYKPSVVGPTGAWSGDATFTINPIKIPAQQPTPEPFANLNVAATLTPFYYDGTNINSYTNFVPSGPGFGCIVSGFLVECNSAVATT